jgi:hypothetical protein
MNKLLSVTAAMLVAAALSTGAASAKHHRHPVQPISHAATAPAQPVGNNAELMGNNGNSGSGMNSLGHIPGGDNGGGE